MSRIPRGLRSKSRSNEDGASAVEYAIVVSLIAVVIFVSVAFFGQRVGSLFDRAADCTASPGAPC
jgi:Flp pilus assembly pilin Flp